MSYRSGVAWCIGASTAKLRRVVRVTLPDELIFKREGGKLWYKCSLVEFPVLVARAVLACGVIGSPSPESYSLVTKQPKCVVGFRKLGGTRESAIFGHLILGSE